MLLVCFGITTHFGEKNVLLVVQAYLAGLTSALATSPCSTSVLATLLGYVATSRRKNEDEVPMENQKCRLMSITGKKQVVAEGRWASDDPDQRVHFVPLGSNAVKVWIDIVKVNEAAVWRPSEEIEFIEDAIGSSVAWPKEKVIMC